MKIKFIKILNEMGIEQSKLEEVSNIYNFKIKDYHLISEEESRKLARKYFLENKCITEDEDPLLVYLFKTNHPDKMLFVALLSIFSSLFGNKENTYMNTLINYSVCGSKDYSNQEYEDDFKKLYMKINCFCHDFNKLLCERYPNQIKENLCRNLTEYVVLTGDEEQTFKLYVNKLPYFLSQYPAFRIEIQRIAKYLLINIPETYDSIVEILIKNGTLTMLPMAIKGLEIVE